METDSPDLLAPVGGGGALIGYARVSTKGQNLDRQITALETAGCQRIFSDKKSGKNAEREELKKALDYLRPGDTLLVSSLDRLGRSIQDLINIVGELRAEGIGFRSLHESLDTTTPGGRLVFHVFAALAEFIRELIVQGTHEGLAAARARGQRLGRPLAMTEEQIRHAYAMLTDPEASITSIAKLLGVSRTTIYKYVPELAAGRAWVEELAVNGGLPQITPLREGIPSDQLDAAEREEIRSHAAQRDLLNVASNELGNAKRRKASREEEKRRRKEEEAMDRTWHQAAWRQVADQIREATGGPISPADIPIREVHASAWSSYQAYRDADRRLEENIAAGLQFRPGVGVVVEGGGPRAQEKREALQQLNSVRPGLDHYVRAYCGAFSAVDDGDYRGAVGAFERGVEAYRNNFRDRVHMARYLSLIPWAARALDPWAALAREAGIDKKGPEFTAWVSDDPAVREAIDLYRMDASGWLGMARQAWDTDVAIQMLALGAAHIPGFTVPHLLEGELKERLATLARDRQATREMCLLLTEATPKALDAVYGRDELAESDAALGLPSGTSARVIRQVYSVDPGDPNSRAAKLLQRHTEEFDVAAIPDYSGWKGPHIAAVRVAAATFYSAGLFPHVEPSAGSELLDRVKSTWMPGRRGIEAIEELDERLSGTAA